jgi:hypothetical protein
MRHGKKTKGCPGYYKESEKPKEEKIHGHYKSKDKMRIVWDEFYAAGKRSTGYKYNVIATTVSIFLSKNNLSLGKN